jgi:CRISPR-associated protein Cmr3
MEMKSAGGNWLYAESLNSNSASCRLIPPADLYRSEIRTGIALDGRKRTAREGYLYSLTHVRLNPGVKLVFGVDRKLPLQDRGILRLGGEQRFGGLERISALEIREGSSGLYMSLALIEGRADNGDAVVASGRPVYIGGWDMSAGFHKPMRGYYPAGTGSDEITRGIYKFKEVFIMKERDIISLYFSPLHAGRRRQPRGC